MYRYENRVLYAHWKQCATAICRSEGKVAWMRSQRKSYGWRRTSYSVDHVLTYLTAHAQHKSSAIFEGRARAFCACAFRKRGATISQRARSLNIKKWTARVYTVAASYVFLCKTISRSLRFRSVPFTFSCCLVLCWRVASYFDNAVLLLPAPTAGTARQMGAPPLTSTPRSRFTSSTPSRFTMKFGWTAMHCYIAHCRNYSFYL